MSKIAKRYFKHILKSNYRLLILVIIVQILIFQNAIFPISSILLGVLGLNSEARIFGLDTLLLCICIMAFCTPLYQYRFLMKRNSSDLYLSLPIKREDFFRVQFLMGACIVVGSTLTSLFCGSLLSFTLLDLLSFIPNIILLELLGLVLYAMFTWLIIKCNSLLDGVIISGAYTLFPLLVILTMYLFSDRIVAEVMISGVYGVGDIVNEYWFFLICSYLSTPVAMMASLDTSVFSFSSELLTMSILLFYWFLLGITFYFLSKKAYTQRKGELSGERTNTWVTYPIMIPLFTFCLLSISGPTLEHFISLMFIFIAYFAMYAFAKRSLKMNVFMIFQFLCLLLLANGVERIMKDSHMFGRIQETFEQDEIKYNTLDITFVQVLMNEEGVYEPHGQQYESKDWDELSKDERQTLIDFHKETLGLCDDKSSLQIANYPYVKEEKTIQVNFYIFSQSSLNRTRGYKITEEENLKIVQDKIGVFMQMGIIREIPPDEDAK